MDVAEGWQGPNDNQGEYYQENETDQARRLVQLRADLAQVEGEIKAIEAEMATETDEEDKAYIARLRKLDSKINARRTINSQLASIEKAQETAAARKAAKADADAKKEKPKGSTPMETEGENAPYIYYDSQLKTWGWTNDKSKPPPVARIAPSGKNLIPGWSLYEYEDRDNKVVARRYVPNGADALTWRGKQPDVNDPKIANPSGWRDERLDFDKEKWRTDLSTDAEKEARIAKQQADTMALGREKFTYDREQDALKRQDAEIARAEAAEIRKEQQLWSMAQAKLSRDLQEQGQLMGLASSAAQDINASTMRALPYAQIPGQTHYLGFEPGGVAASIAQLSGRGFDADRFRAPIVQYNPAGAWNDALKAMGLG